MAKVLLVDTNFSSGPIYSALRQLGHEVHVVGGNPFDCLAKLSNQYWNIDYADTNALKSLVNDQCYDFIVPGCTDRSYTSCVEINDGRFPGLCTIEVDKYLNNKAQFRLLANSIGLSVPRVQNENVDKLRWPLIVKPVDSFSGKGITVLEREKPFELENAIMHAVENSSSGQYLIEDFVAGQLYSYSSFLVNCKVIQDFTVQENCTANQFVVDTSFVESKYSFELKAQLRTEIEALASFLKLPDGLLHVQYICTDDSFFIIEVTRRCPGDLYSQLIELSTGYNYTLNYVRPFLGVTPYCHESAESPKNIVRHTLTLSQPCSMEYLKFNRAINIVRWVPLSLIGDKLYESPKSRIAIMFLLASSDDEFNVTFNMLLRRELYCLLEF